MEGCGFNGGRDLSLLRFEGGEEPSGGWGLEEFEFGGREEEREDMAGKIFGG